MNKDKCPECQNEGKKLSFMPVKKLLKDSSRVEETAYSLCMDKECNVSYYNTDIGQVYHKDDLGVSLWYKSDAEPKYVCYCAEVTEEEVIDAVVNKEAKNMDDIIRLTGAMNNSNCKENNPLGKCCHKVIEEAIEKGLEMKKSL